ncbi:GyrI-like domain-containing protein [Paenibacillus sp. GYB003]|uniref:GyrI-like domain-containing protein n=1 Tax=Paenibacillus sp. GYB003 TaxID=2994392 RepID=UPI002F963EC1
MEKTINVEIVTVPPLRVLAVRTSTSSDKGGTRAAWRKLTEAIPQDDSRWSDTGTGYVMIPQREWGTKVESLWVGLRVLEAGAVPEGIELLELPESLCAKLRVYGDEAHMNEVYGAMFGWLRTNGEYELDPDAYGVEANRLEPVNPFTIPYESVSVFDFDMLYPIRKRSAK